MGGGLKREGNPNIPPKSRGKKLVRQKEKCWDANKAANSKRAGGEEAACKSTHFLPALDPSQTHCRDLGCAPSRLWPLVSPSAK